MLFFQSSSYNLANKYGIYITDSNLQICYYFYFCLRASFLDVAVYLHWLFSQLVLVYPTAFLFY